MFRFKIFSIILILCSPSYQNNSLYCITPFSSPGIFIYNKEKGKDDYFVGKNSVYFPQFERSTLTELPKSWRKTDSLEENLIDEPVLDERWETFLNNHKDETKIQKKLQEKMFADSDLFWSIRLEKNFKLFQKGWNHFKSNISGIYLCQGKKCFTHYEKNISAFRSETNRILGRHVIWKLHNYVYFYTRNETNGEVLYENYCTTLKGPLCFSFYAAMCDECFLFFTVNHKRFKVQGNNSWTGHVFCTKQNLQCFNISITTKAENEGNNTFWTVGETWTVFEQSQPHKRYMKYDFKNNRSNIVCENALNQSLGLNIDINDSYNEKSTNTETVILTSERTTLTIELNKINNNGIFINTLIMLFVVIVTGAALTVFCFLCLDRTKKSKNEIIVRRSYENESLMIDHTAVKRKDFKEYVRRVCGSNCREISVQFLLLSREFHKKYIKSCKQKNLAKNYKHHCVSYPYDFNRVKIKRANFFWRNFGSDYINASYVQGFYGYHEYIVAQNPLETNVDVFWTMICQENIHHIVMLTSNSEKYSRYWPDFNKTLTFRRIEIKTRKIENVYNYKLYKLQMRQNNEVRDVNLSHFHEWDDTENLNMLARKLVPFVEHLLKIPHYSSPVLFHCSDGIGRSGVVMLCDMVLRALPVTESIDLYSFTRVLRSSRANMVANLKLYKLAHVVIDEYLNTYS